MSKRVITPVGTSLFENYMDRNGSSIKASYKALKEKGLEFWDNTIYASHIKKVRKPVTEWAIKQIGKSDVTLSAEITSIMKILEEEQTDLDIYLLATETIVSRLAAEILKNVLSQDLPFDRTIEAFFETKDDIIPGLQVRDRKRFEKEGMVALVKRIGEMTYGYEEQSVINVTGGYKATIPYLTIMGQIKNIPLYYTFEESPYELLKIPQAPLDIHWGLFEKYSHAFTKLSAGVELSWEEFKQENQLREDFRPCIYEDMIDGRHLIGLNAIGEMFWDQFQRFFLVHLPLGGKYFEENATKKREVNKAIQELYRRLLINTTPLEILIDTDLKHVVLEEGYVYKHSNPQLRIHYQFDEQNKRLSVYNYFYKPVVPNYSGMMAKEFADIKKGLFTTITLKKEV